jgi:hypothetical protein
VSALPSRERERADSISKQLHELLPEANLVRVFCPGVAAPSEPGNHADNIEPTVSSFAEAIKVCLSSQASNARHPLPRPQLADVVRAA